MDGKTFVDNISRYSGSDVFNPYSDICNTFDRPNANQIRRKNLIRAIESFSGRDVDAIWIGRDLGHRGGRRTGLALTDEPNLSSANDVWGVKLQLATKGQICKERTAENIWKFLRVIDQKIFLWNVFPFHPHARRNPHSNRSHTAKERDAGLEILRDLVSLMRPKQLVAIGNEAFNAIRKFDGYDICKVRHPSYGGEKEFARQICDLYRHG